MAHIITLQLLVRDNDEENINQALQEMLTEAQSPVDPDDEEVQPWLASWSIKSIDPANEAVEEALLIRGEEVESILDKDFVICFAGSPAHMAFRSNDYGPVCLDLATKYGPTSICSSLNLLGEQWQEWKDRTRAYVTIAPYGLQRFTAKVMGEAIPGRETEAALKAFELWANSGEQARAKVEKIYSHENIISVRPV